MGDKQSEGLCARRCVAATLLWGGFCLLEYTGEREAGDGLWSEGGMAGAGKSKQQRGRVGGLLRVRVNGRRRKSNHKECTVEPTKI